MDGDSQRQSSGCCYPPLMEETENIKKYKPILIVGIVVYCAMCIIDLAFFGRGYLFEYIFIIICQCFMYFNRCFLMFQFQAIFSIILLFLNYIPSVGIAIQNGFDARRVIAPFIVHLLMIIFYFFHFYLTFKAYKEMKYVFANNNITSPQLSSGFKNDFYQNNNSSPGHAYNNNSSSSGGFKAFSGKGYTVGGS